MKSVVSIIIPVYNRLEITKKGLNYINNSINHFESSTMSDNTTVKVVVVDDGSTDGTSEWIQENLPEFTVLNGDGSLWWTGAVNKGIQYCMENFENLAGVVLQNDDVILDETWIFDLIQAAANNPIALVGCATSIQEEKHLIYYGGRKLNPWFAKETKLNFKASRSQFEKGYVTPSFDLYGRGLYIPTEVFKKVGLFDQNSFKHRGDMDIPLRAKKAGYKLLVSYDAVVYEMPQLTYGLDVKKKITIREAYKLMTDFRSSNNLRFIYKYSKAATQNELQFFVFFLGNLFYNVRGVSWRLLRNYIG